MTALVQEGLRQFGEPQTSLYLDALSAALDHLAMFPKSARLEERLRPPMRVHRFRSHVVIYMEIQDGIRVVRLRHGREDWLTPEEGAR